MARMIPAVIDAATRSPGEKLLFKRLRDDPATDGWIVLHSYNLPRHVKQVQGEADFVVLAPGLGLLVLEVKAHHRVARLEDGRWRLGSDVPSSRSPFDQADMNLRSVMAEVRRRARRLADATVSWSAVAFTHCAFDVPAAEWNEWEVIDTNDIRRRPISGLIAGVLQHARSKLPAKALVGAPTRDECAAIAELLRPRFEVFRPASHARAERERDLLAFTEEQYIALDGMAHADRVVFRGPAGTGKTVLAVEEARRAEARGQRTLVLCYNALLGESLRQQTADLPNVRASTLHGLMCEITKRSVPGSAPSEFWQEELPEAATAQLLEGVGQPFDVVILDEAQDLLRDSYLDVIDLLLDGGLAAGRWRMFGDWERQALYEAADVPLSDFLGARAEGSQFDLRTNCRNTPKIARWVSHVAMLSPAYNRIRRPDDGPPPRTRYYEAFEEQEQALTSLLDELYSDGYEGRDIVLLSYVRDGVASRLRTAPWRDRVKPYRGTSGSGFVRYATVQSFKGLEAPVIVMTDVDEIQGERARSLFYTAITRPTERLYVLAEGQLRDEMLDLVDRFSASADLEDRE
jgi:hypothetical protein